MTFRLAALLLLALPIAGCARSFEGRITEQLHQAGLPRPIARCMADYWTERLGVLQLREISRLSSDLKAEGRSLTVGRLVRRVAEVDDPEIYEVVTVSTARCALSR